MYQVESTAAVARVHRALLTRRLNVSRVVVLLGLTSLFTDISSEMVATILPVYLVYTLGLSPFQFGIIDGIYQGSSALVRIASGFLSDRTRRYKTVAGVGYGLSAVCKPLFLIVGSAWGAVGAVVLLDRTGKGIRTSPRDAMISLSTPREKLGTAFGVHRALDTTGAMLGPLIGFGLLLLTPDSFDSIFVVSFCFALIGLGILALFVKNPPAETRVEEPKPRVTLRAAAGLLRGSRYRALVIAGTILSLATISDGFLYLGLQRNLDFDTSFFPLLFVGTSFVYMILAVPIGRLADRIGRGRVFVGGYALLLLVYLSLLLPSGGAGVLVVYIAILGTFYAATDGVLMALTGAVLPASLQASGLSFVVTATSVGRLVASIVFGALWTWAGLQNAVLVFGACLVLALAFAAIALRRTSAEAARA